MKSFVSKGFPYKDQNEKLFVAMVYRLCLQHVTLSTFSLNFTFFKLQVPPHLHLTTSEVMVIVWRLRGNIIRTVLYITNVLPLQWAQLTKTVHTARLGLEFFLGCVICLYVGVCFVLPLTVESFPSCFGTGVTNLKQPPSSFLLTPRYCGLGAGPIPLRATVNKKQCEMRGLFMSLVIHY